jgi:hypothetical protein
MRREMAPDGILQEQDHQFGHLATLGFRKLPDLQIEALWHAEMADDVGLGRLAGPRHIGRLVEDMWRDNPQPRRCISHHMEPYGAMPRHAIARRVR